VKIGIKKDDFALRYPGSVALEPQAKRMAKTPQPNSPRDL
jgi:hypothetical protein